MGGGSEIFEEDDPKYLRFLQTRADVNHSGAGTS